MLLLAPYAVIESRRWWDPDDCPAADDPNTTAAARTSSGHAISVSLRPAPPPALSRICLHCPELPPADLRPADLREGTVLAAHGDSLLIYVALYVWGYSSDCTADYFVYSPGAATGARRRPPSLHLLPRCYYPAHRAVGFLRGGGGEGEEREGELVVAELRMVQEEHMHYNEPEVVAELLVLRAGEWRVKRPRIIAGDGDDHGRPNSAFKPQAVVPLAGRRRSLLCWVDFASGIIFSDALAESPTLRFVPFPEEAVDRRRRRLRESSCLCVTARGEVKLASVSPAAVVTTWTLKTEGVAAAWVVEEEAMGGEESGELRAIDMDYCGISRVQLVYPLADMDGGGRVVAGKRAAKSEGEDERNTGGKGKKRGVELSSSSRRSKRVSKRNVRVTGKEWVN